MIPAPLVEAAAKALAAEAGFAGEWETYGEDAVLALRAAFAALPECEEAQAVMRDTLLDLTRRREYVIDTITSAYLAALARMAEK